MESPQSTHWSPDVFRGSDGAIPFEQFVGSLPDFKFAALDAAIDRVLSVRGMALMHTEWLKALGEGLHEFRVRHDADEIAHMFGGDPPRRASPGGRILLRVFIHFHGEKAILLLGGYDKGKDPSDRRQQREIAAARR